MIVEELIKNGKNPVMFGPLIHNTFFNNHLNSKGVRLILSLSEVKKNEVLLVRAHGITRNIMKNIKEKKINYKDATCPFVLKIHEIANNLPKNTILFLAGDKNHPEVKGIASNCISDCYIFKNSFELLNLLKNKNVKNKKKVMVFQTTFSLEEYKKCSLVIEKSARDVNIVNTICLETCKRQKEAALLSKVSDVMLVIGDKKSSNTRKLEEVCKKFCETHLVESFSDLKSLNVNKKKKIGITAGASTPGFLIKQIEYELNKRGN